MKPCSEKSLLRRILSLSKMYYDEISQGYEELHREEQIRKLRKISSMISMPPFSLHLDVACGTGLSTGFLGCTSIGLDPATQLLEKAKVPVVQGVAEALPFKDSSFDIVTCVSALHNFNNPEKALKEMRRVGKEKWVITVFRKGINKEKIGNLMALVHANFNIIEVVEDQHDFILFCEKFISLI